MTKFTDFKDLPRGFFREDNRATDAIREVVITPDYVGNATGSVLIECGRTRIICAVTIQNGIPRWMMNEKDKTGWLTAEYSLLPYAGTTRKMRDASMGKVNGRTHEIQRLIGRSLRGAVDLSLLGDRTIWIDCDVIEADGGTRTAAITGAYIALTRAVNAMREEGSLKENPLRHGICAVSVGLVDDMPLLDLNYAEDVAASVDLNVVMTHTGTLIEVQGTAEGAPFSRTQLDAMLTLAEKGCTELYTIQQPYLAHTTDSI